MKNKKDSKIEAAGSSKEEVLQSIMRKARKNIKRNDGKMMKYSKFDLCLITIALFIVIIFSAIFYITH